MKTKLTLLTALLLITISTQAHNGNNTYQIAPLVQQSLYHTTINLLPVYSSNLALVKINHYTTPLKMELYNPEEKVVRNITIESPEQVTTLNLENLKEEFYILRIYSNDGNLNYVFRINKQHEL